MQNNALNPDEDYVNMMHDFAVQFNKLALSNFEYYIKIIGTDVTVRRAVEGEFKSALGSAYIFDGTDQNTKIEVFKKRIVINRSQLLQNFRTTTNDIEAYINEDFFKIGDQLEFKSRGVLYKYKVTDIDQFDPYNELLYKLTLAGFEEHQV